MPWGCTAFDAPVNFFGSKDERLSDVFDSFCKDTQTAKLTKLRTAAAITLKFVCGYFHAVTWADKEKTEPKGLLEILVSPSWMLVVTIQTTVTLIIWSVTVDGFLPKYDAPKWRPLFSILHRSQSSLLQTLLWDHYRLLSSSLDHKFFKLSEEGFQAANSFSLSPSSYHFLTDEKTETIIFFWGKIHSIIYRKQQIQKTINLFLRITQLPAFSHPVITGIRRPPVHRNPLLLSVSNDHS